MRQVPPEGHVSKAEYARRRGVSRAAVGKWVETGKVVTSSDRAWIHVEQSDARLVAMTDQTRGGKNGKTSSAAAGIAQDSPASEARGAPAAGNGAPAPAQASGVPTLADANRERALAQARMAELRLRRESGELVERSAYERALVDSLGPIVEQLGTISARLASRCAAETDARKVTALIDDEINRVRQAIAAKIRALIDSEGATAQ